MKELAELNAIYQKMSTADVDEAMRLIREYDKRLDMLEKLRHKKMKEY